jgi:hypothetical protein
LLLDYTESMNNTSLIKSIQQTLIYFDLFSYPLTAQELWYFLWQPPSISYEDFLAELNVLVEASALEVSYPFIETKQGYYFLSGKVASIAARQEKIVFSDRWLARARLATLLIQGIPFLKAVFVCNSVGAELATPESDIDFLIIAAPGQVWFVRFWANVILRIVNMRTYGARSAGKICLSFFVDTEHVNLGPYRVISDDIHFAYWLFQMVPVYDPNNYYAAFLKANTWLELYLPHSYKNILQQVAAEVGFFRKTQAKFEFLLRTAFGDKITQHLKKWQWKRLDSKLKIAAEQSCHGVVLEKGILKFHEHDTRLMWKQKWLEECVSKKI